MPDTRIEPSSTEPVGSDALRVVAWALESALQHDEEAVQPATSGAERENEIIGRYQLVEPLGEGGFGMVWRARQISDVTREVALKVIKPGMDTREVIARFEAERETLARMTHPHIASVLDAGTTANGRPYFVMELVAGLPITTYCDRHRLNLRERSSLFIHVCKAVHHAHQKAFIHRDLKPGNVLVVEVDGKPHPKVIDFGIGKALGHQHDSVFGQSLLCTIEGRIVGTPQYMSPEQTGGSSDVDTRSDIYSLGVILYELLVGETPLAEEQCQNASLMEILELIRTHEPLPPSARWKPGTAELRQVAQHRRTEPRQLCQELRGDLDWIALKALEKDRDRRYASANGLAEDLRRHLENRPVQAGPPGELYRLRKLILRHKVIFAALSAVLAGIIVGGGMAFWQWREAKTARSAEFNARRIAETREREATIARDEEAKAHQLEAEARARADDQRQQALTARARAEDLINYLLFDLRDKLDPVGRINLLDEVARKAGSYFDDQPEAGETDDQQRNRGAMFQNRGLIDLSLGHASQALAEFQSFFKIMSTRAAAAPQDTQARLDLALAHDRLGLADEALGRGAEARGEYQEELDIVQPLADARPKNISLQRHLAGVHERLGGVSDLPADAWEHYQSEYALCAKLYETHPEDAKNCRSLATSLEKLGDHHVATRQPSEGLRFYERELTLLNELNKGPIENAAVGRTIAVAWQKKGAALQATGASDPAEAALRRSLEILGQLAMIDPGNLDLQHDLALAHDLMAAALYQAGRQAEAATHWNAEFAINTRLAVADPANSEWQRERAVMHWGIAQAHLREGTTASVTIARTHYSQGIQALRDMERLSPLDSKSQRWLKTFEEALEATGKLKR